MANFQPSKAEAVAREDWIEDSQGYFELNYERFAASWFQLADLWTDHISVECYYVFLHQTLECLSFVEETKGGGRVRRLRPPHAIISIKAYRAQQKKKSILASKIASKNNQDVWAMSLTSSKHKHARREERILTGTQNKGIPEPPPVSSDDSGGAKLLEQWMSRQLVAGCSPVAVKEALMQHAANAPPWSGLAQAAAAVASGQLDGPYQQLVEKTTGSSAAVVPPLVLSRTSSASRTTTEKLTSLASPKVEIHRTKECVMLEHKMAQLISTHRQAAAQDESQAQQPSEGVFTDDSTAMATAASVNPLAALDVCLSELPSVNGQCAMMRPQSELGSRFRSQSAAHTTRARSARGFSKDVKNEDENRWASEWVASQRQEADRVMAARQAAQAAQVISMAAIEHGLQNIARKPVSLGCSPPPSSPAAIISPTATAPTMRQHSARSSGMHTRSVLPQPATSRGTDTGRSVKLRTEKGRPLTPGGGWRDQSTKMQPTAVPPTLSGAALVSTSWATHQGARSNGRAGTGHRGGIGLSPPPTTAVLTQGGHAPGWLRYTTMMMRNMPLDQVRTAISKPPTVPVRACGVCVRVCACVCVCVCVCVVAHTQTRRLQLQLNVMNPV